MTCCPAAAGSGRGAAALRARSSAWRATRASTSASFDAGIPATAPSSIAFRSSGDRVLCHSSVSFAVTASGRNVSPFASAFALLRCENPAVAPSGGIQTGMCRQPLTPLRLEEVGGNQRELRAGGGDRLDPREHLDHRERASRAGGVVCAEHAASAMRIIHSARSRESMNCTGSVGLPGASTSPPLSMRTGQ